MHSCMQEAEIVNESGSYRSWVDRPSSIHVWLGKLSLFPTGPGGVSLILARPHSLGCCNYKRLFYSLIFCCDAEYVPKSSKHMDMAVEKMTRTPCICGGLFILIDQTRKVVFVEVVVIRAEHQPVSQPANQEAIESIKKSAHFWSDPQGYEEKEGKIAIIMHIWAAEEVNRPTIQRLTNGKNTTSQPTNPSLSSSKTKFSSHHVSCSDFKRLNVIFFQLYLYIITAWSNPSHTVEWG